MYLETVLSDAPSTFVSLNSQPPGTSGNQFLPVALCSSTKNSMLVNSTELAIPVESVGSIFHGRTVEFLALPGSATFFAAKENVDNVVVSATTTLGQTRVVVANSNIWPEYEISGVGIEVGTTVVSKQIGSDGVPVIEISKPATVTGTNTLTFSSPGGSSIKVSNGIISVSVVSYSNTKRSEFIISSQLTKTSAIHVAVAFGREVSLFIDGELLVKKPTQMYESIVIPDEVVCVSESGVAYIACFAVYDTPLPEQSIVKHSLKVWSPKSQLDLEDDLVIFGNTSAMKINELSLPFITPWSDIYTKGLVSGAKLELVPYSGIALQDGSLGLISDGLDCSRKGLIFDSLSEISSEEFALMFVVDVLEDEGSLIDIMFVESGFGTITLTLDQSDGEVLRLRFLGTDGEASETTIDISSEIGFYSSPLEVVVLCESTSCHAKVNGIDLEIEYNLFAAERILLGSSYDSEGVSKIRNIKLACLSEDFVLSEFESGSAHEIISLPLTDSLDFFQYGYAVMKFVCNQVSGDLVDGSLNIGHIEWSPQGASVEVQVASEDVLCGYRPESWDEELPAESEITIKFIYSSEKETRVFLDSFYAQVYEYDKQGFYNKSDEVEIFSAESIHQPKNIADSFAGLVLSGGYCRYSPNTSADNKIPDWSFGDLSKWTIPGSNQLLVTDPTISSGYGVSFDISSSGDVVSDTEKMPVAPNKTHQLCVYVRPTAPITVTPRVKWYNGDTLLSTSVGASITTTSMSPQAISTQATSPSTANWARVEFGFLPTEPTNVLLDTAIFAESSFLPDVQNFTLDNSYQTISFVIKQHPNSPASLQYIFHHTDGTNNTHLRISSAGLIEQSGLDLIMLNGVAVEAGGQLISNAWNHITITTPIPKCVTETDYLSLFSDNSGLNTGWFLIDEVRLYRKKLTSDQAQDVYNAYVGSFYISAADSMTIDMSSNHSCKLSVRPWITP